MVQSDSDDPIDGDRVYIDVNESVQPIVDLKPSQESKTQDIEAFFHDPVTETSGRAYRCCKVCMCVAILFYSSTYY